MKQGNRHKNYEILNLIGYGLSKFDNSFIKEFGFDSKTSFYNFCVQKGIAEQTGVIKNRMDLFDPFFPNARKGWWQKGDTYIHRKDLIDSLFGDESVKEYANIVKLYFKNNFSINDFKPIVKPIVNSRFKKLQETGLEAELYFMKNYNTINIFKDATLEDARLFGDGYDFQITMNYDFYLAEVKGVRAQNGSIRLTSNEYLKAKEYKDKYILSVISNLNSLPKIILISNPINKLNFNKKFITQKQTTYNTQNLKW